MGVREMLRRAKRRYFKGRVMRAWEAAPRPCPVCGSSSYEPVRTKDRYGLPISFVACQGCGLIRQEPFPTQSFLNDFYARGWYHGLYLRTKRPSGEQLALQRDRQRLNVECLRTLGLPPTFSLLDYGTGNGALLAAVRDAFPEAHAEGIEPNEAYHRSAGALERYDVIMMIHVLEHLYDPVGTLRELRDLLNDGGRLIVEVPDADQYGSWGEKPWHIAHPLHFNAKTLQLALERAGLKLETWSATAHPYAIRAVAAKG